MGVQASQGMASAVAGVTGPQLHSETKKMSEAPPLLLILLRVLFIFGLLPLLRLRLLLRLGRYCSESLRSRSGDPLATVLGEGGESQQLEEALRGRFYCTILC